VYICATVHRIFTIVIHPHCYTQVRKSVPVNKFLFILKVRQYLPSFFSEIRLMYYKLRNVCITQRSDKFGSLHMHLS
jgi:hypothetical protein